TESAARRITLYSAFTRFAQKWVVVRRLVRSWSVVSPRASTRIQPRRSITRGGVRTRCSHNGQNGAQPNPMSTKSTRETSNGQQEEAEGAGRGYRRADARRGPAEAAEPERRDSSAFGHGDGPCVG